MNIAGLISIASVDGFAPTVGRLDVALSEHGIAPLLRLDHSAAAAAVGLSLSPVLLIVFGDPRVGTKLMQANPTAGIDLPLKLLVWEGDQKLAWIGYNDPAWIRARHGLPPPPGGASPMTGLLRDLALQASGVART